MVEICSPSIVYMHDITITLKQFKRKSICMKLIQTFQRLERHKHIIPKQMHLIEVNNLGNHTQN